MKDFFISHSSIDKKDIVEELVTNLEKTGFSVWYDKNSIQVGDELYKSISEGLREAYCMILILTSNFLESKWTHIEIGMFSNNQHRRIIPLLYNDPNTIIGGSMNFVGNLKYIDMRKETLKSVIEQLSSSLEQTKRENEDLVITDSLNKILKKLNNYESSNIGVICLKLKEYIDFLENHNDYISFCAKRLAYHIAKDVLIYMGITVTNDDYDFFSILKMVNNNHVGNINIREYFNFFLGDKIEKISTNDIVIVNKGMHNLLKWYITFRYPTITLFKKVEIVHPEELTPDDFQEMYNIDMLVMRSDLVASVETTYHEWYIYNNYTHIAIKDSIANKVIGYCALLPITEETYAKILSGDFKDKDFNQDSIRQYDLPSDIYKLYVAGLALHPNYQNTNAFTYLYNAIVDLLLSLARDREIYISEIIAEASTKQGEKFCNILNMKKRIRTIFDTDVYTLDLIPPEFRVNNLQSKVLYEICKHKYEENRSLFI